MKLRLRRANLLEGSQAAHEKRCSTSLLRRQVTAAGRGVLSAPVVLKANEHRMKGFSFCCFKYVLLLYLRFLLQMSSLAGQIGL